MTKPRVTVPLLVCLFVLAFIPVTIALPAISAMAEALDASVASVQAGLSLYLLGLGIAQLIYGPLSDRWGRKPVLLAGLAIFVAGSLVCAASWGPVIFLVGRFVQALGAAAGATIGRAIVQDAFGSTDSVRVLAVTVMATTLASGLSPLTGDAIASTLGWRAVFLFLALSGMAIIAILVLRLQETRQRGAAVERHGGSAVRRLMRNREFVRNMLFGCLSFGSWYAFIAGAPITVIGNWGVAGGVFALWWGTNSILYICGSYVAARFSRLVGPHKMIMRASLIILAGATAMVTMAVVDVRHPAAIFMPMGLLLFGFAIAQPNSMASAIRAEPDRAGTASGLMGSAQILMAILSILSVGALPPDASYGFVLICVGMSTAAVVVYMVPSLAGARTVVATPVPGTTAAPAALPCTSEPRAPSQPCG